MRPPHRSTTTQRSFFEHHNAFLESYKHIASERRTCSVRAVHPFFVLLVSARHGHCCHTQADGQGRRRDSHRLPCGRSRLFLWRRRGGIHHRSNHRRRVQCRHQMGHARAGWSTMVSRRWRSFSRASPRARSASGAPSEKHQVDGLVQSVESLSAQLCCMLGVQ